MHPHESETLPARAVPSLYLDYGADAQPCGALEVTERGMRFESRWQFTIGTQLAVSLQYLHPRMGSSRVTIEGTVVWCEPCASKRCHECTLLFLELPDELKDSLREFSHLVAG